jgi:integrase
MSESVLVCPECNSKRIYKDGFRYLRSGKKIQRYRCANQGYRFSEHFGRQNIITKLNNNRIRQVGVLLKEAKNLGKMQETKTCVDKRKQTLRENEIKAAPKIEKLIEQLKNDGRQPGTLINYKKSLKNLLQHGADLFNPENTKAVLAKSTLGLKTKKNIAAILNNWYKFIGIEWRRPRYIPVDKDPYIPSEELMDKLIAGLGPKAGTYCQLLRETGARAGEISSLTWYSIDFQQKIIRIKPEKGSNPRTLRLKNQAIEMLNNIKIIEKRSGARADGHIFTNADYMRSNFYLQRRRLAKKLGIPEILRIHFHTFRHCKGTKEYHEKPDLLHVAEVLGHKNINVTRRYIHLAHGVYGSDVYDNFIVKIAKSPKEITNLLELGFEYIMTKEELSYFRKRK